LKIQFESEEVYMENVVPLFKPFKTIFYLKFSDLGNVLFGSKEIWTGFKFEVNLFERFWLSWLGLNSALCLGPHVGALPPLFRQSRAARHRRTWAGVAPPFWERIIPGAAFPSST
jgi:hypothetical protein